ncbi:2'-5' RNA ligase family protein [Aequorivita todarodis]|uniref:2'-5' RNA ligase family protein n=1 Tax=Aequorivita todarodis TaxID=2036821 RepID=UPI0023504147|nr:2'-5' RNA ligase family protein [Aequorivita todarodis]MDC8001434.1 2'-5' RNA ligase family protein [Aequorivita todarodis]
MGKYIIVLAIGLGIFSCAPKKQNTIAIDVLLIPSEEMYAQSLQLNSLINQNNPKTIKLDENHVPHITLLQCFINQEDLPKVKKVLEGLFQTIAKDSLSAESISYNNAEAESFAMISVGKSGQLLKLHEKTIALVKPFIVKNGSEASFIQNPDGSPISESTVAYVPKFVDKYSYENFDPHISLGVAQKIVLDSLAENVFKPIKFKAASLRVYQLGDHGTAQKLLWKSE